MSFQLHSLSHCLLQWHLQVDTLWHHTPRIHVERTITRGARAGVQETVVRRGQRAVTDGAKVTGEALLKQYRRRLERVLSQPFLLDTVVTDTGELTLPSILVDARMLMQQRSLTERTMRNHLAQLLAVGFIVRKKWHGRKRSFELWINPELVGTVPPKAPESPAEAPSEFLTIGSVLSTNSTKFPAIELPELQETQKLEIGQCGENASDGISEKPSQEAEGRTQEGGGAGQATKQGQGARAAARPGINPPAAAPGADAAQQALHEAYVNSAWGLAKALLYPEHRFSPEQEQLARQAIRRGVYREFEDPHFDFARYHQGVLRRIELVEKHFQKHAGRYYAPMPWAEMIRGRGYFDWENEKGFRGTMAWLQADERAEHLARVNRAVAKALGELKLRRKLDRGGKAPRKPARHILASSFSELYHRHLAALEQLGGPLATDKFNQLVLGLLP